MQSVTIICIGSLKESYWRDACKEYAKRLTTMCKFNIIEISETRLPDNPSYTQIEQCLQAEGKRILSKCPAQSRIYSMCIEGTLISSENLAFEFENSALSGVSSLVFIIGGSHGLSDEVKKASFKRISMSKMTFPHQLARVVLCEQIYRGYSINRDSKYHK